MVLAGLEHSAFRYCSLQILQCCLSLPSATADTAIVRRNWGRGVGAESLREGEEWGSTGAELLCASWAPGAFDGRPWIQF